MAYVGTAIVLIILISWIVTSVIDIYKCLKHRRELPRVWWKELKETTQLLLVVIIFILVVLGFIDIANM